MTLDTQLPVAGNIASVLAARQNNREGLQPKPRREQEQPRQQPSQQQQSEALTRVYFDTSDPAESYDEFIERLRARPQQHPRPPEQLSVAPRLEPPRPLSTAADRAISRASTVRSTPRAPAAPSGRGPLLDSFFSFDNPPPKQHGDVLWADGPASEPQGNVQSLLAENPKGYRAIQAHTPDQLYNLMNGEDVPSIPFGNAEFNPNKKPPAPAQAPQAKNKVGRPGRSYSNDEEEDDDNDSATGPRIDTMLDMFLPPQGMEDTSPVEYPGMQPPAGVISKDLHKPALPRRLYARAQTPEGLRRLMDQVDVDSAQMFGDAEFVPPPPPRQAPRRDPPPPGASVAYTGPSSYNQPPEPTLVMPPARLIRDWRNQAHSDSGSDAGGPDPRLPAPGAHVLPYGARPDPMLDLLLPAAASSTANLPTLVAEDQSPASEPRAEYGPKVGGTKSPSTAQATTAPTNTGVPGTILGVAGTLVFTSHSPEGVVGARPSASGNQRRRRDVHATPGQFDRSKSPGMDLDAIIAMGKAPPKAGRGSRGVSSAVDPENGINTGQPESEDPAAQLPEDDPSLQLNVPMNLPDLPPPPETTRVHLLPRKQDSMLDMFLPPVVAQPIPEADGGTAASAEVGALPPVQGASEPDTVAVVASNAGKWNPGPTPAPNPTKEVQSPPLAPAVQPPTLTPFGVASRDGRLSPAARVARSSSRVLQSESEAVAEPFISRDRIGVASRDKSSGPRAVEPGSVALPGSSILVQDDGADDGSAFVRAVEAHVGRHVTEAVGGAMSRDVSAIAKPIEYTQRRASEVSSPAVLVTSHDVSSTIAVAPSEAAKQHVSSRDRLVDATDVTSRDAGTGPDAGDSRASTPPTEAQKRHSRIVDDIFADKKDSPPPSAGRRASQRPPTKSEIAVQVDAVTFRKLSQNPYRPSIDESYDLFFDDALAPTHTSRLHTAPEKTLVTSSSARSYNHASAQKSSTTTTTASTTSTSSRTLHVRPGIPPAREGALRTIRPTTTSAPYPYAALKFSSEFGSDLDPPGEHARVAVRPYESSMCIEALPDKALLSIFSLLSEKDRSHVAQTCHRFRALAYHRCTGWRRLHLTVSLHRDGPVYDTDSAVDLVCRRFPDITDLHLTFHHLLSDRAAVSDSLSRILRVCPLLQRLELRHPSLLPPSHLSTALRHCLVLRSLALDLCPAPWPADPIDASCTSIQELDTGAGQLGVDVTAIFPNLRLLHRATISTDAHLASLAAHNVEVKSLTLQRSPAGNNPALVTECLKQLGRTGLESLDLRSLTLPQHLLRSLLPSLTNLKSLSLPLDFDPSLLADLSAYCWRVESLTLVGTHPTTTTATATATNQSQPPNHPFTHSRLVHSDSGPVASEAILCALERMPRLRNLSMQQHGPHLTSNFLYGVRRRCPTISNLYVSGCPGIADTARRRYGANCWDIVPTFELGWC